MSKIHSELLYFVHRYERLIGEKKKLRAELRAAKATIKRLEKCLRDIGSIVDAADMDIEGHGGDPEGETAIGRLVRDITNRMGRTLTAHRKSALSNAPA